MAVALPWIREQAGAGIDFHGAASFKAPQCNFPELSTVQFLRESNSRPSKPGASKQICIEEYRLLGYDAV
jgi:hypothetical protein